MRYAQFCALARAAELVGERWTLLIVRELLLGPRRFVDLRARLRGVSPSVLTERLARAETAGLVRRRALPPPAAAATYELTDHGEALRPVVHELIRWGGRFLLPMRRGERVEPEWMRLALAACARRGPTPARAFRVRVVARGAPEAVLRVAGGARGTVVGPRAACAEDVESGTTSSDCHPRAWLKASRETTMTGLRPRCSEPERGARSAQ